MSEGGSDTHQLHLMEMMGFAGSTYPTDFRCSRGQGLARKNSLSGKSVSSPSRKNISLNLSGKSLI
jgi:hypothetical protein